MKFLIFIAVFVLIFGLLILAQDWEGLIFDGKAEDFGKLPSQNRQGNEFTFARLIYNGRIQGYLKNWYTDYPKGDKTLIDVVKRLTNTDIAREERAIPINHPDLFSYPFIYSVEGGQMILDENDSLRLREYLNRGGFWMVDDFWGTDERSDFEGNIKKIFPDREIVGLTTEHPIFHTVFNIENLTQVPNVGYAYCNGCPTWELDGHEPMVSGIFDDNGRLMVAIYFNTDTMDAMEWADDPNYPHHFSAYAYKIFINTIMYAMTH